ncbi:hypothetical protein N7476_002039 [Penicillium atrosanguineum]|uniref:polynucleotide adenylyltransferase n=1 Tax=Penicillium atrosanguineum TaxID=1132637 RepID=A0A9W9Q356_9EURO|nr:hypothetical protein N7476_002039 [Penicillium atrosanguineum]
MDAAVRRVRDPSSPTIELATIELPPLDPLPTCAHSLVSLPDAVPRPRKHLTPFDALRIHTPTSLDSKTGACFMGSDILPEEKEALKEKLTPEEEKKLTEDIEELYERLLPSAESDDRRRQLVAKLEKLFNEQWPGHEIKAKVFGSSGNKLCSSDSDVDICITTDYKALEHVCLLAEVLAKHGMERVVCVSHAKVPIVKIWDPELRLACDMNVNNTLALENTRMIRTYVDCDRRVRVLAMVVKHWTKRRILNDAALGSTLSSYTWICLIINFLQTRNPPIVPSLQARPHQKKATPDGVVYSFDDDLDTLQQFGQKNRETSGQLLFAFFRYYGHELNYEKNVISVREGGLVSKDVKGWTFSLNNRLCVEEPFNTSRNLGNTADDTSFRGLHIELRRAFGYIAKGDLAGCCEQFEFPPEEERTWERPPPQPRPTLTPSVPTRGGRGGGRGGRFQNQFSRGGFAGGRRTSNTGRVNSSRQQSTNGNNPSDLSLHAQQQAQFLLHDQLYQQIQLLQAQEQELRMQLHNQALITGRPPPVFLRQPFIQFPMPQQQEFSADENSRSRSETVNQPPLTPLTPTSQRLSFVNPTYASGAVSACAAAEFPLQHFVPLYAIPQPLDPSFDLKGRSAPEPSEGGEGSGDESAMPPNSLPSNGSRSDSVDEGRTQEVMGYYLTPQQLQLYQQNAMASPMGLALQNGYTHFLPVQPDYRSSGLSSDGQSTRADQSPTPAPLRSSSQPKRSSSSRPAASSGPLIVDGSVPPNPSATSEHCPTYASDLIDPYSAVTHYTSTSDDHTINTPASFSDSLSQDFQDSGPFDIDQTPVSTRPFETPKTSSTNGESQKGNANGQPELLASRLQNFHLSNAEKLARSHSTKSNSERHRNGAHSGKDHTHSKSSTSNDKATGSHQGNETRQQNSSSKRKTNGADSSEKANGVNHGHKPKQRGRHDASHNGSSHGDTKDHPLRKGGANGTPEANHGWQTTKKKNRRSGKPSAEPRNGTNGPEPLPTDEALRKGG